MNKVEVIKRSDVLTVSTAGTISAGSKSGGGNSGFQALNLASQFGCRKIILVGFDMRLDYGVHWHGAHPKGLNNPRDVNLPGWRDALNKAAPTLAALGIQVINASPISTLTAYPVMTLQEAIRC